MKGIHKSNLDFLEWEKIGHRVASFFWMACHGKILPTVFVHPSYPIIRRWILHLSGRNILPRSPSPQNPLLVVNPSKITLNQLAGSISTLTQNLQQKEAVLEDHLKNKKKNFKDWPDIKKKMLLNLMTTDGKLPHDTCPAELLHIINQRSSSKAKDELETLLAEANCICKISLGFSSAIQSGDWITWGSDEPRKFTIFALRMNNNCGPQEDSRLRMQLQVNEGLGLTNESIDEIVKFKFNLPQSIYSFKHMFKTVNFFFWKFPHKDPF